MFFLILAWIFILELTQNILNDLKKTLFFFFSDINTNVAIQMLCFIDVNTGSSTLEL